MKRTPTAKLQLQHCVISVQRSQCSCIAARPQHLLLANAHEQRAFLSKPKSRRASTGCEIGSSSSSAACLVHTKQLTLCSSAPAAQIEPAQTVGLFLWRYSKKKKIGFYRNYAARQRRHPAARAEQSWTWTSPVRFGCQQGVERVLQEDRYLTDSWAH
jgi:hypothetical protein